jgi:H+/Cl- antiporter ClcA
MLLCVIMYQCVSKERWLAAFLTYSGISVAYGLLAGTLCVMVPEAAGSGIPEIKAFLNGIVHN